MGYPMELSQLNVQNLVPEAMRKGSVDEFLAKLPSMDQEMAQLLSKARERKEVLRYVGTINPSGKSTVELKSYAASHAFAGLTGSDNIVAFKTQRYHSQPLIVRGPGAGPEVTAGGVFADLLRLVNYVGGSRTNDSKTASSSITLPRSERHSSQLLCEDYPRPPKELSHA